MAGYEFDTLKADVAKLGSELLDLTEKLTDLGKDGTETAKEELERQAKHLKKRLSIILRDARKMGEKTAETVQEKIEDIDLMSLIVATGARLILGMLITWIIKGGDSD
jgi:ElaB/YqjD/DUF883 family membrane-anchored ribosome-binding protein